MANLPPLAHDILHMLMRTKITDLISFYLWFFIAQEIF